MSKSVTGRKSRSVSLTEHSLRALLCLWRVAPQPEFIFNACIRVAKLKSLRRRVGRRISPGSRPPTSSWPKEIWQHFTA